MADFTPSPNESITALADFNLATIRSSVTTISWSCDHLLVINFARLLCGRISRGDHLPDKITCRSTCLARNRIQMPEFSKQHLEILRARGENTKPDIVEEVNGNVPVTESTTSKPTIVAPGAAADGALRFVIPLRSPTDTRGHRCGARRVPILPRWAGKQVCPTPWTANYKRLAQFEKQKRSPALTQGFSIFT
jgi:hypothetical protein